MPNFVAVVQGGVDNGCGQGRKGQAVVERKRGRQEERRVFPVLGFVKGEAAPENSADIVVALRIVVGLCRHQGEMVGEQRAAVHHADGRDEHKDEQANQGVDMGVSRG